MSLGIGRTYNLVLVISAEKAEEAYKCAYNTARKDLHETNPIRLGLALNFSVFYYEIKQNPTKACEFAKQVCHYIVITTTIHVYIYVFVLE